jgi:hypothetical protein
MKRTTLSIAIALLLALPASAQIERLSTGGSGGLTQAAADARYCLLAGCDLTGPFTVTRNAATDAVTVTQSGAGNGLTVLGAGGRSAYFGVTSASASPLVALALPLGHTGKYISATLNGAETFSVSGAGDAVVNTLSIGGTDSDARYVNATGDETVADIKTFSGSIRSTRAYSKVAGEQAIGGATGGISFSSGASYFNIGGASVGAVATNGLLMSSNRYIAFASGDADATSGDLLLRRAAAGTLSQSNGTNGQEFRLYKTTDSDTAPANYGRIAMYFSGAVAMIEAQKAGTGGVGAMHIGTSGNDGLALRTNGAARWTVGAAGDSYAFYPASAGTPLGTSTSGVGPIKQQYAQTYTGVTTITAEGGGTAIAEITMPATGYVSLLVEYDVVATDGVDVQSHAQGRRITAVNKAGTITLGAATSTGSSSVSVSAGTVAVNSELAGTTSGASANSFRLQGAWTSSLAQSTFQVFWRLTVLGNTATVTAIP